MPEGGSGGGTIIRIALEFLRRVRERQARESGQSSSSGPSATSGPDWQPKPPPIFPVLRAFTDYVFKPGATHGKDAIFRALGIGPDDRSFVDDFIRQATQRYSARDFITGVADQYGQRLTIPIDLNGPSGQTARILTAWMLRPDGQLSLCSPYTGYAR